MQNDKVMADAHEYKGRAFSPAASAWCTSACRCFLNQFPQRCFFFCGPLECCRWMNMVLRFLSKANGGLLRCLRHKDYIRAMGVRPPNGWRSLTGPHSKGASVVSRVICAADC